MARLPLVGGAYSPRSIIANCQRCWNLYPERNPTGAPVPLTHYQRPGLKPLTQLADAAPVRGLYRASNGNAYCVCGSSVYTISASWNATKLGTITPGLTNPTSMIDNGTDLLLVDGSTNGWTIHLADNTFAQVVDTTGIFQGANKVDIIDGFIIWNMPGTANFGSTLFNQIKFDATQYAAKFGYPDPLMTLAVNRHEITMIGALKSEVWYDAGLSTFPFAELQGVYYEHGTVATYSAAPYDITVAWLGQDLAGQGVVYRARGYQCQRISNHAVEFQIRKMADSVGIADAIGYWYQKDGHQFYVLHFPAGDQTWVYDDALGNDVEMAWHQEGWTDGDGQFHRHRANCHAFVHGTNLVGDWENGWLYAMDMNTYSDTVDSRTYPLTCVRTFPHISTGEVEIGSFGKRPVTADGHLVQYHKFMLDLECGMAPQNADGTPAQIILRYSDDRGRTWSQDILQSGGQPGEYLTWPTWQGIGMARDRVFEVEYAFQGPGALNGAWVEASVERI